MLARLRPLVRFFGWVLVLPVFARWGVFFGWCRCCPSSPAGAFFFVGVCVARLRASHYAGAFFWRCRCCPSSPAGAFFLVVSVLPVFARWCVFFGGVGVARLRPLVRATPWHFFCKQKKWWCTNPIVPAKSSR